MFEKFISKVQSAFRNPEIRSRIFFTFGMIVLFRFLSSVPLPGTNPTILNTTYNNPFTLAFTLVTGGSLHSPSIAAIGLGSYISASFVVQLLQSVVKRFDEWSKEGARGRMILNQITRFLTVPISLIQAYAVIALLQQNYPTLFDFSHKSSLVAVLAAITAGTLFLMWIAEAITEKGIGNGSTIIIIAGILNIIPPLFAQDIQKFIENGDVNTLIFIIIGFLFITALVIFITEAVRNILIQYSSRVRNSVGIMTSPQSFFPIKLNMAGVMPVIFAQALVSAPSLLAQFVLNNNNALIHFSQGGKAYTIAQWLISEIYSQQYLWRYELILFLAIIAFTFFTTFVVMFKPKEIADNFQKSGAFIPGIRPGTSTVKHLVSVVSKLTVVGALFLALLAALPSVANYNLNLDILRYGLGSTSLLIIVTGILEILRQINSYLVTGSYDGFKK